jgi:hypothetical protein
MNDDEQIDLALLLAGMALIGGVFAGYCFNLWMGWTL